MNKPGHSPTLYVIGLLAIGFLIVVYGLAANQ